MHPRIAQLSQQFTFSTNLVVRALRDVDADALLRRPAERSNPLIWIGGHLAHTRNLMLGLLGDPAELPWSGELFRTGSRPEDATRYPGGAEVLEVWREVAIRLDRRLGELTDAELDAPAPARVPSTDGTLSGCIAYFAFHEAYHAGQLGYLRRWLGMSALLEG